MYHEAAFPLLKLEDVLFTVIIVDDEESTVHLLTKFFSKWGVKVEAYCDVGPVIERLSDKSKEWPILVVIDLYLENSNGIEVNSFMSQHSYLRQVPRIIISRNLEAISIANRLTSGIESFFFKPLNLKDFDKEVHLLLQNSFPTLVSNIVVKKA